MFVSKRFGAEPHTRARASSSTIDAWARSSYSASRCPQHETVDPRKLPLEARDDLKHEGVAPPTFRGREARLRVQL
jgi:hypothetical protein